jgi:hypothetical protein
MIITQTTVLASIEMRDYVEIRAENLEGLRSRMTDKLKNCTHTTHLYRGRRPFKLLPLPDIS